MKRTRNDGRTRKLPENKQNEIVNHSHNSTDKYTENKLNFWLGHNYKHIETSTPQSKLKQRAKRRSAQRQCPRIHTVTKGASDVKCLLMFFPFLLPLLLVAFSSCFLFLQYYEKHTEHEMKTAKNKEPIFVLVAWATHFSVGSSWTTSWLNRLDRTTTNEYRFHCHIYFVIIIFIFWNIFFFLFLFLYVYSQINIFFN